MKSEEVFFEESKSCCLTMSEVEKFEERALDSMYNFKKMAIDVIIREEVYYYFFYDRGAASVIILSISPKSISFLLLQYP